MKDHSFRGCRLHPPVTHYVPGRKSSFLDNTVLRPGADWTERVHILDVNTTIPRHDDDVRTLPVVIVRTNYSLFEKIVYYRALCRRWKNKTKYIRSSRMGRVRRFDGTIREKSCVCCRMCGLYTGPNAATATHVRTLPTNCTANRSVSSWTDYSTREPMEQTHLFVESGTHTWPAPCAFTVVYLKISKFVTQTH